MIEFKSVCFSYNGKKTLDSVSLNIRREDFVGILGPNGAGKSTLIKLASQILRPSSGEILFDGRPAAQVPIKEMARSMAVLPAETHLTYDFTVQEVVRMGRAPHLGFWSEGGERDLAIVEESMRLAGIEPLRSRNIHALSSGERQMVFLAQAMAQQPKILLLDEPTVHLDVKHQIQIFSLLKEWNESRKLTVAVVSHDLNMAAQFCKRLVLFNEGAFVLEGAPREVLTPENIRKVYGIQAEVIASPGHGAPAVFFGQ